MSKQKWLEMKKKLLEKETELNPLQYAMQTIRKAAQSEQFYTSGLLVQIMNVPMEMMKSTLKAAIQKIVPVGHLDDSLQNTNNGLVYASFCSTSHVEVLMASTVSVDNTIVTMQVVQEEDVQEKYWTRLLEKVYLAKKNVQEENPRKRKQSMESTSNKKIRFEE